MKRTWISEHGESYAVPACITSALHDLSWHNDACPCFIRRDDPVLADGAANDIPALALWIEHPDPAMRTVSSFARFTAVCNHEHHDVPETLLETDGESDEAKRSRKKTKKAKPAQAPVQAPAPAPRVMTRTFLTMR